MDEGIHQRYRILKLRTGKVVFIPAANCLVDDNNQEEDITWNNRHKRRCRRVYKTAASGRRGETHMALVWDACIVPWDAIALSFACWSQ
jgi:hypothetical protein